MILATILAATTPHVATLQCGAANLRLVSRSYDAEGSPRAPASQQLTRRVGGARVAVALEPARLATFYGVRVQDRYVGSWACLRGTASARYVLLGYSCTSDGESDPGDCGGDREWFRLLDTRGRLVDRGVPHSGPARTRLYHRLGIGAAMGRGVQMQDVLG